MCKAVVNEDANAKLIRELKEEIQKLREMLKNEGIEVKEGKEIRTLGHSPRHTHIRHIVSLISLKTTRNVEVSVSAKVDFLTSKI